MVIAKLMGGLGNQLFQYAVARHLAELHHAEFRIDVSFFDTYELHTYSIWPFNIEERFASAEEIATLTEVGIARRLIRRGLRLLTGCTATHIKEKHFHFDPEILKLPDGVYLDGYWQSEKYFADIAGIIRREFTLKIPQKGKDKELGELISACGSTSLHIRRGSYLYASYSEHGTCELEYYYRCVKELGSLVRNPHFFVFSDDPEWARNNLKLPYKVTYVTHNGPDKDYEDLRLMSQCKHHIIANSTFSWWGAWLSPNSEKIIFAPRQWFAKKTDKNTKDLIPPEWIKK